MLTASGSSCSVEPPLLYHPCAAILQLPFLPPRRRGRRCLTLHADASQSSLLPASNRHRRSNYPDTSVANSDSKSGSAGSWILDASPTPFNRCVLLRCPSLADLLHRADPCEWSAGSEGDAVEVSYQRTCVPTADGGVISLDWPAELDLEEEQGLDTTVVLVPGTPEGSMDREVRRFVAAALSHGHFPIVMNPRGCAGSPVTTPRLFTAADSDDVSTAIQFIAKLRPWATMTSVSWGYGANMLTKYLADVTEVTPLMAAVCVNNPFDLNEATGTFPYHVTMDMKLTNGMVDILRTSKDIFQGKSKGFNVTKALSVTSTRDFDSEVSMISHGYDSIKDFYSNSSTRESVSKVKIPVLYIQIDDGTVPPFSVPHRLISENPFTSLLCSCLLSSSGPTTVWNQHVIEWLSAVELALLKGRHPLLKDREKNINLSKGLIPYEDKMASQSSSFQNGDNYLNSTRPDLVNECLTDNSFKRFNRSGIMYRDKVKYHSETGSEFDNGLTWEVEENRENNSILEKNVIVDDMSEKHNQLDSGETQILQIATSIMNMLDVTMPGTLDGEQKMKVLTAIEQGETLIRALQRAVPEDVCGKLNKSVTEILENKRIGWIQNGEITSKLSAKELADTSGSDQRCSDTNESSVESAVNDGGRKEANISDSEAEHVPISPSGVAVTDSSFVSDHSIGKNVHVNGSEILQEIIEEKGYNSNRSEEPSASPSETSQISVTQALDALTGFDDSAQTAVNSVFGILESMIDEVEKANNRENAKIESQESAGKICDSPNAYKAEKLCRAKNEENPCSANSLSSIKGGKNFFPKVKCCEKVDQSSGNEVSYGQTHSINSVSSYSVEKDAEIIHLSKGNVNKIGQKWNIDVCIPMNSFWNSPYRTYFHMNSNSTNCLISDSKDVRWRNLKQARNSKYVKDDCEEIQSINKGRIIEPSYIISDNEDAGDGYSSATELEQTDDSHMIKDAEKKLFCDIKDSLFFGLKVQICNRLGLLKSEEIESDLTNYLELVSISISQAIVHNHGLKLALPSEGCSPFSVKLDVVDVEHVVRSIHSAIPETTYLRELLPVGVIVDSSLSFLKKYLKITILDNGDIKPIISHVRAKKVELNHEDHKIRDNLHAENGSCGDTVKSINRINEKPGIADSNNKGIMLGAVTATLGASALFAHHQIENGVLTIGSKGKGFSQNGHIKLGEIVQEKNQNLLSSLSEKALSVAGPVMPMKSEGEIDHKRLVAILAEVGRRGGLLTFIGKFALLWSGIHGAMRVTDKLISFLDIAGKPLFQRIFGFACMVLIMWSPVVVPLLPTLVQSWTTRASNVFAEYFCTMGFYLAIMILIILWGKRIQGYENPLEQYGFSIAAPKVHILKGLLGGVMLVLFIHSVSALLGYASLALPASLPTLATDRALTICKAYGVMLLQAIQGAVTAMSIALVEELFFRSWLPREVAADFGHYPAIFISGLVFAIFQSYRCLSYVPTFLLLSAALFGIKQRREGKLDVVIGIRAGILIANSLVQNSNLFKYSPATPFWLASTHTQHPFRGLIGLISSGILYVFFMPKL